MDIPLSQNEQKLIAIIKHAPVGLVEIEPEGSIRTINLRAEESLHPIFQANSLEKTDLFPILQYIDPKIIEGIKSYKEDGGIILQNTYFVQMPDQNHTEKHFFIVANKQIDGTIMVSFDDVTERVAREATVRRIEIERAVEQEKYEIASDVLHDIGNAVVGFGSYLTRIRRLLEQNDSENLEKLVNFFSVHTSAITNALGEEKARALIEMLTGISTMQKKSNEEISNAITEQLNIIAHIQEVLKIQRQYVSGRKVHERRQVNLRSILNDCMAMLFASFDRKNIAISIHANTESPVIKGDRTKLMQVMLNILKNSLEAIEEDAEQKLIIIDLNSSAKSIILRIRDSGKGFSKNIADKLFERNFTTKSSGSGLGLYNCKAIVENHSGTIKLTSEGEGKGTTVIIEFTLDQNKQ